MRLTLLLLAFLTAMPKGGELVLQAFAGPEEMSGHLRRLGLRDVRAVALTFGTVHLYCGTK